MSVADLVSALTSRVKRRAVEQQTTAFQRFRDELLKPLSRGEAVDDGDAEEILALLDRSPAKLAEDVALYSQRVSHAEKAATRDDWVRRMAEAEALHQKLNAEFKAFSEKMSPQIKAAWDAARAAEAEINTCNWAANKLAETVMDPSIAERERELDERRIEIGSRRRDLQERQREARERISYYQSFIDGINMAHSGAKEKLARNTAELAPWKKTLSEIEAELRATDAELSALQPAIDELNAEKLIP
jgi:chromosome segregation ATPase